MKLTILTTTLLLATLVGRGQSKPHKSYFLTEYTYITTTGCEKSGYQTNWSTNGDINYLYIKKVLVKWLKPYKLRSFEITSLKRINKSDLNKYPSGKFKPCDKPIFYNFGNLTSTNLFADTDIKFTSTNLIPSNFIFQGLNEIAVSISAPDSNKNIHIELHPSQLTKVNDSTFLYKQK